MECICCTNNFPEDDFFNCNQCDFSVCVECFKYGILQQIKDPICLNCKTPIHVEIILELCETRWLYDFFLPHMASILLEKEKDLLPYTQEEASLIREYNLYQNEIKLLLTDKQLKRKYKNPDEFLHYKQDKDNRKLILNAKKQQLRENSITLNNSNRKCGTISIKRKQYVSKCMKEDCKGYVNTEYKCETCHNTICDVCYVILENNNERHHCKQEDKDLAHIIKSNCKQCPKCYIPIMKASGCDQMFCVNCKTGFSWTTGEIETGPIHNPHYFEWLSSQRTNVDIDVENIACGELPGFHLVNIHSYGRSSIIMNIYQRIIHFQRVNIPHVSPDRIKDNIDLRIKFLLDEIDEEKWKNTLISRERKRLKNTALRQVFEMFVVVASDMMRRLVSRTTGKNMIEEECRALWQYTEDCLDRVCNLYGGNYTL